MLQLSSAQKHQVGTKGEGYSSSSGLPCPGATAESGGNLEGGLVCPRGSSFPTIGLWFSLIDFRTSLPFL